MVAAQQQVNRMRPLGGGRDEYRDHRPGRAATAAIGKARRGTSMDGADFVVLVNSWWEPLGFVVPETRPGAQWQTEIDSYDPAAPAGAVTRSAGDQVTVGPRSVAVLCAASPR
jgi:hypothetical protein